MAVDDFNVSQQSVLAWLSRLGNSLSLAGSLFIIACYLGLGAIRRFSFSLIFFLSLADAVNAIAHLLGDVGGGALCYVQAYAIQFASLASVLWTTAIAFTLHRTAVRHKQDTYKFGARFHAYVWGISVLLTVGPQIGDYYGDAGIFCWIRNDTAAEKVTRMLVFYVPLWAAVVYNGVVYYKVSRALRETAMAVSAQVGTLGERAQREQELRLAKTLKFYPLILIVCYSFPTANRIQQFAAPRSPVFWLYCLHALFASLQGLLNCLAYGFNVTVRRALRETLLRVNAYVRGRAYTQWSDLLEDDALDPKPGPVSPKRSPLPEPQGHNFELVGSARV
eukprot:jgi/Chlat1/2528/Chrsp175S02383